MTLNTFICLQTRLRKKNFPSKMKISVRVARMSQRKPHGAKTTWLRPVKMFAHMGLHTEVPFLYRTHVNTVIHLKHTVAILICTSVVCVFIVYCTVKRNSKLLYSYKDKFSTRCNRIARMIYKFTVTCHHILPVKRSEKFTCVDQPAF